MTDSPSSEITDNILAPTEYDPDVAKYTDPFYKILPTGEIKFRDNAIAKLFRDATAGTPEEIASILKDESISGVMRRILTDDAGILRAAILAKAMKEGLGKKTKANKGYSQVVWLKFAMKIINETIEEGRVARGGGIPLGAGTAIKLTEPIRGLLRKVEGTNE